MLAEVPLAGKWKWYLSFFVGAGVLNVARVAVEVVTARGGGSEKGRGTEIEIMGGIEGGLERGTVEGGREGTITFPSRNGGFRPDLIPDLAGPCAAGLNQFACSRLWVYTV